ncbi:hypothetical protein L2E82_22544 [Cichorium intybus]|uniref:Uncharacterized protein n=1 Tax=Cichorium intybus TaxID=13427 RepID=A0ACB9DY25_CICIN|nr:hypothetical protein L2E82_22544 [Cichorium intybus]
MTDKQDSTPVKALHPVYTVTNIQNKIRTLDGTKVSYSSWVRLFKLHARGYKVLAHIDGSDPPPKTDSAYETWSEIDAIVLQWIYGTISDDLLARVLEPDSTAYEAWFKIQNIFLNNKGSRAAALEHEFTNLTLKAMSSLEAYCQRLKDLASQLNDVDCPVNENRLVLQLVRGLPSEFDKAGAYINQTLPPWDTACSMLQLELQRQRARDSHSSTEIVAAVEHAPPANSNSRRGESGNRSGPQQQRNTNRRAPVSASPSRPGYPSSGRQTQTQSNNRRGPVSNQTRPTWAGYPPPYWAHPYWASPPPCPYPTQAGWAPPWSTSSAQQQARQTQAQANLTEINPLEPSELGAAFSAMTLDQENDDWYMDTGSTSHLTANAGLQDQEAPL